MAYFLAMSLNKLLVVGLFVLVRTVLVDFCPVIVWRALYLLKRTLFITPAISGMQKVPRFGNERIAFRGSGRGSLVESR